MGLLGSIYFYCYAVMQLPAGLLSDSIGPRKSVTVFLLIASAGSILFGLSPNISVAFAGRILVGFGVSMAFIPTIKILSQWFRPNEFAFMAGILQAVGGAGVLAATWLLAIMTVCFGWRLSFELIGIVTLIVVVFLTTFISAHCSLFEATLYSTRMATLEAEKASGTRSVGAVRFINLKKNIAVPIASILILNTISNTGGAALDVSSVSRHRRPSI